MGTEVLGREFCAVGSRVLRWVPPAALCFGKAVLLDLGKAADSATVGRAAAYYLIIFSNLKSYLLRIRSLLMVLMFIMEDFVVLSEPETLTGLCYLSSA